MKKFDWERVIWCAFALLGCIGLLVFLGTTAQHYWQNKTASDFWDLATAVFAFFGTLMTAGAAFATAAAVISYFSVNDKLREARSSLDQFNEIDQQRKQLGKNIAELKKYQATVQDLERHDATETDQSASISVAQQILQNPHADFESRLKAHAIVEAEKMRQKFKEIEISPSESQWRELIAGRSNISAAWKILFLSAPQAVKERHIRNYSVSLFNQAVATKRYGDWLKQKNKIPHALEKWREAGEKYALALEFNPNDHKAANNWGIALNAEAKAVAAENLTKARQLWQQASEKYAQALAIKPDKHEAANNWGNALNAEAKAVAAKNLTKARQLWQQASEKYALALKFNPNYHKAANNWGNALHAEARAVAPEEPMAFWQEKMAQVLALRNTSPAHQASTVIQNLVKKIEHQCAPES